VLKPKRKYKFKSESELALPIVNWLKLEGWEVYKEVKPKRLSAVADIVAVKNNQIWIIETKLNYGSRVIEQAYDWRQYADFISIAVPRTHEKNVVFDFFVQEKGIGVFWVSHVFDGNFYVHLHKTPKIKENILREVITESLRDEQKDSVAGAAGGGYSTDYKVTISKIKKILEEKGPLSIQNIVDSIEHHYKSRESAIQTLMKRLFEVEKDFEKIQEFGKIKIKLKSNRLNNE
jgi:hypothetical protein